MRGRFVALVAMLALTALGALPALAAGGPDRGEGQLAEVGYGSNSVEWRVFAEHEAVTLTISTPCGVIQRVYDAGQDPFFDLRELAPDDPSGAYTWQIRVAPVVDSKIRDMLTEARGTGEEAAVYRALWRKGLLPRGPFLQTGAFSVVEGSIVPPEGTEEKSGARATVPGGGLRVSGSGAGADAVFGDAQAVFGEQVISGDLVVYNSICVGFDCPTNPSFGADTIRLQENNLRIHADDTSTAASFPSTDWRIEFNSNVNGGGSYFRVIDASANRNIMTLEASAPSHSLYVDNGGRVGFGTQNPVVEMHSSNGDTPTLRLEQNTSSGFAAQTWDVAGNETSFFIRDATNGSTLPFRIRPGASSNSLVIDTDNDVGIGILSPTENLHIRDTAAGGGIFIETNGAATLKMDDTSQANTWQFFASNAFQFDNLANTGVEFQVNPNGDVIILGTLTTNGPTCGGGCDRVFADDFELESIEEHAEYMWANMHLPGVGPTVPKAPFNVSEKTGGILNELEKAHIYIEQLNNGLKAKNLRIQELEQRLAAVESMMESGASDE